MAVVISGKNLKIENVYNVAFGKEKVELHKDAIERIKEAISKLS